MTSVVAIAQVFGLVFVAELGDKSQLVCLALAARHGARPVVLGASLAFALLNLLGVVVGAALAAMVPRPVLLGVVSAGFVVAGVGALRSSDEEQGVEVGAGRSPWLLAFGLTFASELGDKTQLAVAGLAGMLGPVETWIGATLALVSTSVLGAVVGRTLLARLPPGRVKAVSGLAFLAFGAAAALEAWRAGSGG